MARQLVQRGQKPQRKTMVSCTWMHGWHMDAWLAGMKLTIDLRQHAIDRRQAEEAEGGRYDAKQRKIVIVRRWLSQVELRRLRHFLLDCDTRWSAD